MSRGWTRLPACSSIKCPSGPIPGREHTGDRWFWFHGGSTKDFIVFNFVGLELGREIFEWVDDMVNEALLLVDRSFEAGSSASSASSASQNSDRPRENYRRLLLMRVSMGGFAVLEYARWNPWRVKAVASLAG